MRIVYILLGTLIVLSACSVKKLPLRSGLVGEHLQVCVDYGPEVPAEMQMIFDQKVSDYMLRYNTEGHFFKLSPCRNPEVGALRIYIEDTRLVSSAQQTAGIVISALGLLTPVLLAGLNSPIYLCFYYFPRDLSHTFLSLSPDLRRSTDDHVAALLSSPGFLVSMQRQKQKHSDKLVWLLEHTMKRLEHARLKNYKQSMKKQPVF